MTEVIVDADFLGVGNFSSDSFIFAGWSITKNLIFGMAGDK
jgi:hypothetical protein